MARKRPPQTLRQALPGLRRTVRHLRPQLRQERGTIALGIAALLTEVVLRLAEPWPLKFVFDRVIVDVEVGPATGIAMLDEDPMLLLVAAAGALIAATGLRAGASYVSTISFALAGSRVLSRVRDDLYRHLQDLSLSFHTRARAGDLVTRLTGDVGRLKEVVVTAALPLTVHVVTLVSMVTVMLWLDWQLTLITVAVFPLFISSAGRTGRKIRDAARQHRLREGEVAAVAAESLAAIKTVHAYSLQDTLQETFTRHERKSLRDGVKAKKLAAGLERRTDLLIAVATGAVLLVGARLVMRDSLTPGDLLVFLTYLKNAFKPMRDVAKYTGRLAAASASGERIIDVLEREPEVKERADAVQLGTVEGALRFEQVTLAYEAGRPVLHGVDLRVDPGETIALVGSSGAGKSSLLGLVLRLFDPDEGRVLVDGYDLRDVTLRSLRQQVGVVLQEPILFHGTVRENIAYSVPHASRAQVVAAACLANAHDFILALPDGYDTVVGERGATLSGGERQRIAIAHAALRDPRIILLDEPTTGLDRENAVVVLDALRRLSVGRTTLHVAHDLQTICQADRILVIEAGRIVEEGTHEDLLGRPGRYATLHAIQPQRPRPRRRDEEGLGHARVG